MVRVSGRLLDFVEDPSNVAQVQVRAQEVRPHGDGVMLDHPVTVEWDPESGVVSFDAPASAMGVIMWHAVGRSNASGALPIIVPDADSASLADCVRNAEMAGERDASELAGILEQIRGSVGASAEARAGAEAAAVDAAGSAVSAGRDAARAEAAAVDAAGAAVSAGRDAARAEAAAGKLDASTFLTGTGFPEGRVAAPVGAIYTDTAATAGAVRWIKTQGTGNTGWQVQYGDTGWRNVSSSMSGVLESGKVFFRRRGDTVDIVTEWAKFIPSGSGNMPAGFIPFRNDAVPFYASANLDTPVAQLRISYTGNITINVFDDRYSANDQGTLTTSDPWPTSLPGTPA